MNILIDSKAPYSHPSIPFEHYILPVPPNPQPGVLHSIYNTLLTSCSFAILRANPLANPNTNHNLIITPKFMMAVPRLLPAYKDIGANSLSLLGIIWVKDEGEAGLWREEGVMTILTKVTIPRKGWRQENNYGGLEATEGRHGSMMTWLKRGDSDGDAMSIMSASSWDNSSGVDSDF